MAHPHAGLDVGGVVVLDAHVDGVERERDHHVPSGVEGQPGPLAPLREGARDRHGSRADAFDRRAGTDVQAQPRVLGESVVAHAGRVSVELDGVDGLLRDAALGGLELQQYTSRDVTAAQARRLYEHAAAQVRKALEPYGYYSVTVDGELRENGDAYVAVLHVTPGEPVKVATVDVQIDGDADGQRPVRQALAAFAPAKGAQLHHAAYEKSKATIQAALFGSGYLEAELVEHRVEVTRSANTAEVHLAWKVGTRYRLGATEFEGGQFPDEFMQRYVPWQEGDFYTQDKVLELQPRLIDADYFAVPWRGRWETEGGGTTLGHGIHQLDLLAHLLGDWSSVQGRLFRLDRETQTEDVSTATIVFDAGVVAQVITSAISPRETSSIRIDTQKATVTVDHLYGHGHENWRITPAPGFESEAEGWAFPDAEERSDHAPLLRDVFDALLDGTPLPPTADAPARSLELVAAIYASAAADGAVITPEILATHPTHRAGFASPVIDLRA